MKSFFFLVAILFISAWSDKAPNSGICGAHRWTFDEQKGKYVIEPNIRYFSPKDMDSKCSIQDLRKVKSVVIESGVASIINAQFDRCINLQSVTIGKDVKKIYDFAFNYCMRLTEVTIPDSVELIYADAFHACHNLKKVKIGKKYSRNVVSVSDVFSECESIEEFEVDGANPALTDIGGVLFSKKEDVLVKFPSGKRGNYTIPDTVKTVEPGAFSDCVLDELRIPYESMRSVVTVDSKIKKVIYYGDPYTSGSRNNVLMTEKDDSSAFTEPVKIPDYAFLENTDLESVTLPDTIESIGAQAFNGCANLKTVDIPNSVTSILAEAFRGCSSLTSIKIPDSVTVIEPAAFKACSGLESVNIPDSVTEIGWSAFSRCSKLTVINVDGENPNYTSLDGILFDKEKATLIQHPAGKGGEYTIPASVVDIEPFAFRGCSKVTGIKVADGNKEFASSNGVLFNSDKTTLINYPNGKKDKEYTVPDSVRTIDYGAFKDSSLLTSVEIGGSVTLIDHHAFAECANLETVTYKGKKEPDQCDTSAFEYSEKVKQVCVPKDYSGDKFCGVPVSKSCGEEKTSEEKPIVASAAQRTTSTTLWNVGTTLWGIATIWIAIVSIRYLLQ